MNENTNNENRRINKDRKPEDYYSIKAEELQDIDPDIPADPSPDMIKKLIGEVPAQIEYIQNKGIEIKKKMQDLKLVIRAKKAALELEKSKIRQESLENYQKELKSFVEECKKMITESSKEGKKMTKTERQELMRIMKPEKPTKNDLDDLANLKTEQIQKEIFKLERMLNNYDEQYELLNSKANRYENKNLAARLHARIMEQDLKRY